MVPHAPRPVSGCFWAYNLIWQRLWILLPENGFKEIGGHKQRERVDVCVPQASPALVKPHALVRSSALVVQRQCPGERDAPINPKSVVLKRKAIPMQRLWKSWLHEGVTVTRLLDGLVQGSDVARSSGPRELWWDRERHAALASRGVALKHKTRRGEGLD